MNIIKGAAVLELACAVLTGSISYAQQNPTDNRGSRHRPPKPPIDLALDTDNDQIIGAGEIDVSSASLMTLDADGDGRLIAGECQPARPDHEGGSARQEESERGRHRPPEPLVFSALDTNGDEVIDADEVAASAETLLTLDSNSDGQLSPDEYKPRRSKGQGSRPNEQNSEKSSRQDGFGQSEED
ncbi:MAG: hypothetical protein GY906_32845 [bacterium]|nr:hypothetical protein [bacterium]